MQTFAIIFPGAAHCACCSRNFQQCDYNILPSIMTAVVVIVVLLIFSLKYTVLVACTLQTLRFSGSLVVSINTVVQKINRLSMQMVRSFYTPFKQSTLELQRTVKVLVCEDPDRVRAKFHVHEKLCDMWMNYRIVANFLWNMTEDYDKYPKINCITDLWKYLDSMGDSKVCGYEKLIRSLEHSLEEISSFHLGHDSILQLITGDGCLLESEEYKCNANIQKIIKNSLEDFVEMTNIDELQPIMEVKQLLTTYDIALLKDKTGTIKVHYILTELLNSKGHRGYMIFLECLEEENKHWGHQTIIRKINSELKKSNMFRPRKYVFQELHMSYKPKGLLSTVEYLEACERLIYWCQAEDGFKLDYEIHQFVVSHSSAPEAVVVGLLTKAMSFKFRYSVEKLKDTERKIEQHIPQIEATENRSIIKGNWYLILSCWNRHLGNFEEAKEFLKKAKGELFSLASGDDRAKILYNEASLLIEGNSKLGSEEEKQALKLLQDAMRCFKPKPEGISIMQVRCLLKKAHCHIGSNLCHYHKIHRQSHLKEANSILVAVKKHLTSMPVRLQMHYYIVECDYNRTIGEKSKATSCLQKGLDLPGSKKFKRDLSCLQQRQS